MKVEIQVPVIGWGQARKGQTEKPIFASVPKVFDIPEYGAAEVPVVLSFSEKIDGKKTSRKYFGHEGRLFTDRRVAADDADARVLTYHRHGGRVHPFFVSSHENYLERIAGIRRESEALGHKRILPEEFGKFAFGLSDKHFSSMSIQTFTEAGFERFVDEYVEEQIAAFSNRMRRMISVGGRLFVEEQEPLVRVKSDYGRYLSKLSCCLYTRPEPMPLVDPTNNSGDGGIAFVSLASLSSLERRLAGIGQALGFPVLIEGQISGLEINDPRYLRCSGEGLSLAAAADRLRMGFFESILPHGKGTETQIEKIQKKFMETDPTVLALVHRIVRSLAEVTDEDVPDEMESSLSTLLDIHDTRDISGVFGRQSYLALAADALQAWHDREIDLAPQAARNLSM